MKQLILARHAHARSNADDVVSAVPPGEGLSDLGLRGGAWRSARRSRASRSSLGVSSRLLRDAGDARARARADGRAEPSSSRRLDEIGFGAFEGGALAAYRGWAWPHGPGRPLPGRRRERAAPRADRRRPAVAARPARGRSWPSAMPSRFGTCSTQPTAPSRRSVVRVPHATPYRLERAGGRAGRRDASRLGRLRRVSPIPPLVDDERARSRCILGMTVRRLHAPLAALVAALGFGLRVAAARPSLSPTDEPHPGCADELRCRYGAFALGARAHDARARQALSFSAEGGVRYACQRAR